ncbi:MAG TPA: hypothetical protein VFS81_04110, partial [Candidatus Binatia bacterium]|nr:hypothetical protein [Candidatus Binatia bacterium]
CYYQTCRVLPYICDQSRGRYKEKVCRLRALRYAKFRTFVKKTGCWKLKRSESLRAPLEGGE